jgi:hypothetical protein
MKIRHYYTSNLKFLILFAVCITFIFSCSDREKEKENTGGRYTKRSDTWIVGVKGLWVEDPGKKSDKAALTGEQKEQIDKLHSIGYLSAYKSAPSQSGVGRYDKAQAYNGLNLCISGHKPEAVLMGMDGSILHRWSYEYKNIKDAIEVDEDPMYSNYWRRVYLYENGDLLAIYEGLCLIKLDKLSRLKWSYPARPHHDLYVTKNGEIYVLTREAKIIPRLNKDKAILEEYICRLSPDGKELERVSLIECIENSPNTIIIPKEIYKKGGDLFHTNSLELIDPSCNIPHPAFKPGNFLISIRQINLIAIVDIQEKHVPFVMNGSWRAQHESQLLANGNILFFDNTGYNSFSRIIEINPINKNIEWEYVGTPPESFHSTYCGGVQRLSNGNTLITETCSGKAFEVRRGDKQIVWEYVNPNRGGDNNELIAALLHVTRLRHDFPIDWIPEQQKDHP